MNRREMLQGLGTGAAVGALGLMGNKNEAVARAYSKAVRGLPPLKITNVKSILTNPQSQNLVIVRVEKPVSRVCTDWGVLPTGGGPIPLPSASINIWTTL